MAHPVAIISLTVPFPKSVPPNVKFVVDDVEDEWGYENDPFDFIHARYLAGSVKDMKRLFKQCYE